MTMSLSRQSLVDLVRPVGPDRDVVLVHPGPDAVRDQMLAHLPGEVAVGALVGDEDLLLGGQRVHLPYIQGMVGAA